MDEIPLENLLDFSVRTGNEDDLWRKIWTLYLTAAQNLTTDDASRQVLLQLEEDAKRQHTKMMKQIEKQQEKTSRISDIAAKWKAKISEITSNPIIKLFLYILRCFSIIIIIATITVIVLTCYHFNSDIDQSKVSTIHYNYHIDILTGTTKSLESYTITISKERDSSPGNKIATTPYTEVASATINHPIISDHIKHNVLWTIPICFLLLLLYSIVSNCIPIRKIIILVRYIPWRLYRKISVSSDDRDLSLIDKLEKIVLLNPMEQHSHLRTLFEDNLLVYASIYDCFHELDSNRLKDYTLFLSLSTFEVHSSELCRLSNVSLSIFYEDNDQSHSRISKTEYHIRFMFPKARLLEYLRHTITLNYAEQAYMYRLQGSEYEADESFLVASRLYRMLADDLGQQIMLMNGREGHESVIYEN